MSFGRERERSCYPWKSRENWPGVVLVRGRRTRRLLALEEIERENVATCRPHNSTLEQVASNPHFLVKVTQDER